jgi:hypothetical protein
MESENYNPNTNPNGPNFSMTLADNDSTQSFINKFASKAYPDGKVLVKNTTGMQKGYEDRTLVSHNVEGIMAGNALSRNPAMATVAYDRLTTSTLEGQLAFASDFAGADVGEDDQRPGFSFPNPQSGNKSDNRFLEGTAAYEAAISSSVLGTSFAPGFFQQKAKSYGAQITPTTSGSSSTGNEPDGTYYTGSPDALSLGPAKNSYPASLVSDLTESEKRIYTDAIQLLNTNINLNEDVSSTGFSITASESDKALLLKRKEVGGVINDRGTEDSFAYRNLPEAFLDLPDPSSFYPSLALMKMLIEISDPNGLSISGGFGLNRGKNLNTGSGNALMSEEEEGKGIFSDHAFGRSFDIFQVGDKAVANSAKSIEKNYKECFEKLMTKIATLPKYLQPDSVVISRTMYAQYVSDDSQRKQVFLTKFPGLSNYLSVGQDAQGSSTHNDHIHIGFHWTRAGNPAVFLGTSPGTADPTNTTGTVIEGVFNSSAEINTYIDAGRENYMGAHAKSFTKANSNNPQEKYSILAKIMATTGLFNKEEIAVFCGITERESNATPYSGDGAGNLLALGMFQNELYNWDSKNKKIFSFSTMDFDIPYGESTRFADQNGKRTLKGWQIYFSKESGIQAKDLKARDEMTWDLTKVDPVFWIPLNQIAIAAQVARIYKKAPGINSKFSEFYKDGGSRSVKVSRILWGNWADGQWGGEKVGQDWGFLTNVRRSTVKAAYESLGGKWSDFIRWALGTRTAPGALCDAFRVADVKNGFDKNKNYFPYRTYWDVFIWVHNLFDKAEATLTDKGQFDSSRYPNEKVFAPDKRKTIFDQTIVESILGMPYLTWEAYNSPRSS